MILYKANWNKPTGISLSAEMPFTPGDLTNGICYFVTLNLKI